MKFTATALVVAIAASFGVNPIRGESLFDENGRELRGRHKPKKLGKYQYYEPANFTGVYRGCHYSVIRSSSTGIQTGTFHACIGNENTPLLARVDNILFLQQEDEFGAYKGAVVDNQDVVVEFSDIDIVTLGGWQGFAVGDTLSLNSIGVGVSAPGVDIMNNNDSPDTNVCTLFDDGILGCTTILTEYCTQATIDNDFTASFCQDREGEWLNTYSIKSIKVKEGFECPEPPPGFCETNPFPDTHPLDPNNPDALPGFTRHLEDEEEESFHPCPILAAQMKMND